MKQKWWQEAVVYQIYPRSFMDGNGDGIGDIKGIIQRLDYIKELGVDVIWLSPINQSPMMDNGYDISDYYKVDKVFGTNADLEELIAEAKKRGLKLLLDLVVNHVSNQHPWFLEALEKPNSPYRDYFIFKETEDGKVPNNFRSYFGGSVWTRVGDSNEFYFHAFAKEQPDLNWENKKLRREIIEMMIHWHKKGIAGFRVDAIGNIKKSREILSCCHMEPDGEDGLKDSHDFLLNQEGIGEYLTEMRDEVFQAYDSMTVAEIAVPEDDLKAYIGENGYFSMVFDFSFADIDVEGVTEPCKLAPWDLRKLKSYICQSQMSTQRIGWAAPYLENHDQPRSVNKYLPDGEISFYSITMLGALYFFLRGTPYIYQGQELGMSNYPFVSIEEFNDVEAHTKYKAAKKIGKSEEEIIDFLRRRSRDNARTPMQWSNESHAGFTNGTPWLLENSNYTTCNANNQVGHENSVFTFYKHMIALRKESSYKETLVYGEFIPIETERETDFVYKRVGNGQEVTVIINYSNQEVLFPEGITFDEVLLSNYSNFLTEKQDAPAGRHTCHIQDAPAGRHTCHKLEPYQVLITGKKDL